MKIDAAVVLFVALLHAVACACANVEDHVLTGNAKVCGATAPGGPASGTTSPDGSALASRGAYEPIPQFSGGDSEKTRVPFAGGALTDGDTTYNFRRKPVPYAYWQRVARPQLVVDLGGVYRVRRVSVHLLNRAEGPHGTAEIDVLAEDDPLETPENLRMGRITAPRDGWNEIATDRVVRALRIVFKRAPGKSYVTLSEIAVRGRAAAPDEIARAGSGRATDARRVRDGIAWWAFDFGPAQSPGFADFRVVDPRCVYSRERGFGWIPQRTGPGVPGLAARDRGDGSASPTKGAGAVGNALHRDFVVSTEHAHPQVRQTFALDVPDGLYRVATFHGDTAYGRAGRQAFWIEVEGRVAVPEIVFPASRMTDVMFDAQVRDGQLNLTFDARDPDPARRGFVLNGLVVLPANDARERAFAERRVAMIRAVIARERAERFAAEFTEVPYVETRVMASPGPADTARGFMAWTPNWMELVYPNSVPTAQALARPCATFAAPGEFEPVTVALRALRPLQSARIELGALAGPGGSVIPASALRVRSVKCWPQRIGSSWGTEWRVLPELLEDTDRAQVDAGRTHQFWITLRVPDDARPGEYRGPVRVVAGDGALWETTLRLEVLPFTLAPAERVVGMYWREEGLAPEMIDRQVTDMVEHGMRAVTLGRTPAIANVDGRLEVDTGELRALLARLRRLGITGPIPYHNNFAGPLRRAFPGRDPDALYPDVIRSLEQVSGRPDTLKLLHYPVDEIGNADERGARARQLCALIAQVPGATSYVTVNKYAAGERWGDTFDIWCGNIEYTAEQERRLLARGKRYMRYGSAYLNDCRKARSSCGFGFYRRPAEAMYYWHYQTYKGDPCDDFDGGVRDHCAVYPGPDGALIPTLDWESLREGVDDLRYIATLKRFAARAGKGDTRQQRAAERALADLDAVLATDDTINQYEFAQHLEHDAYNALRRRIAERAAALGEEIGDRR